MHAAHKKLIDYFKKKIDSRETKTSVKAGHVRQISHLSSIQDNFKTEVYSRIIHVLMDKREMMIYGKEIG
jgi:hypothetical protein